jgi:hypothetical protein
VIVQIEREEVIGVLTNDSTWRRSCGDDHMTALNRGGKWCSDGEMVSGVRRRNWSRRWMRWIMGGGRGGYLIVSFIGP